MATKAAALAEAAGIAGRAIGLRVAGGGAVGVGGESRRAPLKGAAAAALTGA